MLTADAMNGFKDHVKKTVSHAMYKINSSYYRAEITDIYVDSTGKVAIDFTIDKKISQPFFRFSFRFKSSFCRFPTFSLPISISVLYQPLPCFRVFFCSHLRLPPMH